MTSLCLNLQILSLPPKTVICTAALTATTTSTIVWLAGVLGQNYVVLPPPVTPMDTVRGVACFAVLLQWQSHSKMPVVTQAYVSYAMGPLNVSSLTELNPALIFYFGACYGVYFLVSGSNVVNISTSGGSTILVCILQPWIIPLAGICTS